jgi:hypothetical protein
VFLSLKERLILNKTGYANQALMNARSANVISLSSWGGGTNRQGDFMLEGDTGEMVMPTPPERVRRRSENNERRSCSRFAMDAFVAPRVHLVDISEGGAQLEVPWAVPVGSVVELQLSNVHPRLRDSVPYQVLSVRPVDSRGRYRIHGHFATHKPGVRQQLRAAMDEMAQSLPSVSGRLNPER